MGISAAFSIRRVRWHEARSLLSAIRQTVFVAEQRVPEDLEWDGRDGECIHLLAAAPGGEGIGTGRLLPDGHIGRMAVLVSWRGKGVGAAMLAELIAAAREQGHAEAHLSAQTHAIGFYRRFGFEPVGSEYMDAGIAHRAMRLAITPKPR